MNTVTINVPYSFRIEYLPPRCRNVRMAIVRDYTDIRVVSLTADEAPLAFSWNETIWTDDTNNPERNLPLERRWYKNTLLKPLYMGSEDREDREHYSVEKLSEEINSKYCSRNPFIVQDLDIGSFARPLECPTLPELMQSEGILQETIDKAHTKRPIVIQDIQDRAAEIIVIDGLVWVEGTEPRYSIQTFGLGNNHGGTSVFIQTYLNSNIGEHMYFNALEYDVVCKKADEVALNRGDTDYVPCQPENRITVHIPDAVKFRSNQDWYSSLISEDIQKKMPDVNIPESFLEEHFLKGTPWRDAIDDFFAKKAEQNGGYLKRRSSVQLGDVSDTWEVVKFDEEDGTEDIIAVVQTETLADLLMR